MGSANIGNLTGSSQAAGSKVPQHVMLVDSEGVETGNGPTSTSWTVIHRPGANAQATATKAAPGASKRLVCTGITVTLVAGATAPTAVTKEVSLIDGASGGSTYLWGSTLAIPNTAGAVNGIARYGKWVGTANTAMTLEFASAAGANTTESVSFEGYVIDV